jgi:hypothetical protein
VAAKWTKAARRTEYVPNFRSSDRYIALSFESIACSPLQRSYAMDSLQRHHQTDAPPSSPIASGFFFGAWGPGGNPGGRGEGYLKTKYIGIYFRLLDRVRGAGLTGPAVGDGMITVSILKNGAGQRMFPRSPILLKTEYSAFSGARAGLSRLFGLFS